MITQTINHIYPLLFSEKIKMKIERVIFITAIIAFLLHLGVIALGELEILPFTPKHALATLNFLSAIYTPFTIILLYEVYSLIYYFPKSLSLYLGKQYELIVLILVRKIFYELSTIPWHTSFELEEVKALLITFVSLIVFSLLIFLFYKLSDKKQLYANEKEYLKEGNSAYHTSKRALAIGLLLLFVFLLLWSIFSLRHISHTTDNTVYVLKFINSTFLNIFFAALILTEVLVLLSSFQQSEQFHKIIRNSGFIISTVLLKLSFKAEGYTNLITVLGAIAFGVAVLAIYRLFDQKLFKQPPYSRFLNIEPPQKE